jgi:predicted nucleic acid-binding protein
LEQAVILVDTNVLVDVVAKEPDWYEWSYEQMQSARTVAPLCINSVIYAELAAAYKSVDELEGVLKLAKVRLKPMSRPAAFLAGHAFLSYRRKSKGTKTGVLPDFFIGAQAQTEGWTILTRDAGRYKTYFPRVKLICP